MTKSRHVDSGGYATDRGLRLDRLVDFAPGSQWIATGKITTGVVMSRVAGGLAQVHAGRCGPSVGQLHFLGKSGY
jgi:hypothetical protein